VTAASVLCAVVASVRLGAGEVLVLGHHLDRMARAMALGAAAVYDSGHSTTVAEVVERTGGGPACVLVCADTLAALRVAVALVRPGGAIATIALPQGAEHQVDLRRLLDADLGLLEGVVAGRDVVLALLDDVVAGRLDASQVVDLGLPLARADEAYAAMDDRSAVKAVLRP
jgi:threonine dehydrogenase-like Zn-dependent dehydrogenase